MTRKRQVRVRKLYNHYRRELFQNHLAGELAAHLALTSKRGGRAGKKS